MGFMKFGKKKEEDKLDIPPPPPQDDMPPPLPGLAPLPPMPDLPSPDPLQDQPNTPEMAPPMNDIPPPPPLDNLPTMDTTPIPMPEHHTLPEPKPEIQHTQIPDNNIFEETFNNMPTKGELSETLPHQSPPRPLEEPTPKITPHLETNKRIFIEVTKYKRILKDLNNIKKELREADEEVTTLIKDINDEEDLFGTLHANLSDVEKKLIELEGSLFS